MSPCLYSADRRTGVATLIIRRIVPTIASVLAVFGCMSLHAQSTLTPAAVTPPANREDFHIYLLMGQSNMVGRDTRGLSSQVDNPRVLSLAADGQWIVAREPITPKVGHIDVGVGPGISFASEMLRTTDSRITIGLVPCAVGGTPLRRWTKGKGGDLYENTVARARVAAKFGVIKGMLWHQGEADTEKQENADSYGTRLTGMFKDLRADLGVPDLPVVVGQLGEFLRPEKQPFADTVRAAIKRMPSTLPHVGYADSAELTDKGDHLHFTAESQGEFGKRYAKAMQELQKQP